MRFVRSVLLVAACMAAAVSHAQSSGQWLFSMDDARRVTGMAWSSNSYSILQPVVAYDQLTSGNRVEVRRINGPVGKLPQQLVGRQNAFTVTPSGAVIELPSRVRIPGKTSDLPVKIVEPVAKRTLAKTVIRALPIIGTAFTLADFLDELEAELQNNQLVVLNPQYDPESYISNGNRYSVTISGPSGSFSVNEYRLESFCQSVVSKLGQAWSGYYLYRVTDVVYPNVCRYDRSPVSSPPTWSGPFVINASVSPSSDCPSGSNVSGGNCLPSVPQYIPLTEEEAIQRADDKVSLSTLVNILNSLPLYDPRVVDVIAREIKDDPQDNIVKLTNSGHSVVQVGEPVVTTRTNPDGSTETTTTTTTATVQGNQITFVTTTQTVTKDAAGNTTSTTTTTTTPTAPSNPNSPVQEIITCGLPDTPPCKIDETGTPSPPEDDGENRFKSLIPNCLKTDWKTCFPELPEINWSFSLPSGCSPIPVPFGRFGFTEVNICPWQGMIHDIMSMLWAAAGLFGAIGILSGRRNSEG